MKNAGYHEGYKYTHDYKNHFTEQQYLPPGGSPPGFIIAPMA